MNIHHIEIMKNLKTRTNYFYHLVDLAADQLNTYILIKKLSTIPAYVSQTDINTN